MSQSPGRPLRGRNILVVEDDTVIALDLAGVLEAAGATVIGPAHDLSEAVSLVDKNSVRAAVLDYRLQDGDTLPLARLGFTRHPIPVPDQRSIER